MTSKNFQIVALDIGHSTLKLAYSDGSNLQTFERFPTAVALTPKGEYPQSDLVRIADFEYVVGDNAVQHLQSDRVPYVDNSFIGSRHYEVLIKGAVVRLKAKKIDRLIVSLPDGLYTEKKSQVTELIGDALDLGFGRVCEIGDLMLYKQGAACALASGLKLGLGKLLFVDIGYKTMLIKVRQGTRYFAERSASHEHGGSILLHQIARGISDVPSTQAQIVADLLDSYTSGRQATYRGKIISLNIDTVRSTNWQDEAMNRLQSSVNNFNDIESAILSGGCGQWLTAPLQAAAPHLKVIQQPEPHYVVVKNMLKIASIKGTK
jgi:Actin like proteins N terminal domain